MAIVGGIMVPHPPLIVPEVGRGEEEKIRTTAEHAAAAENMLLPDHVVEGIGADFIRKRLIHMLRSFRERLAKSIYYNIAPPVCKRNLEAGPRTFFTPSRLSR